MYLGPSSSESSTPPPTVAISAATASTSSAPDAAPAPFSLAQHAPDRTTYVAMTRLPYVATIDQLEHLTPFTHLVIRECLSNIYFHVVNRDADNLAVFFHHLGGTVMYEAYSEELINYADHAIKAAGIVNMINKTLNEIQSAQNSPHTNPNQKRILSLFEMMIMMHKNILIEALRRTSQETKARMKAHQNLDVDACVLAPISPQKVVMIGQQYPATPSPQKGKGTPKKLTDQDRESIKKLKQAARTLVFESSSDEEDEESESYDQSPDPQDSDYSDSDDSHNSLDEFLLQESNKALTPYFCRLSLATENATVSATDWDSDPDSDLDLDIPSSPVKPKQNKSGRR